MLADQGRSDQDRSGLAERQQFVVGFGDRAVCYLPTVSQSWLDAGTRAPKKKCERAVMNCGHEGFLKWLQQKVGGGGGRMRKGGLLAVHQLWWKLVDALTFHTHTHT